MKPYAIKFLRGLSINKKFASNARNKLRTSQNCGERLLKRLITLAKQKILTIMRKNQKLTPE
jgi:hypothetical protein